MSKQPKHGETPTHRTRNRWCDTCKSWTWESHRGVFRHGRGFGALCRRLREAAKATGDGRQKELADTGKGAGAATGARVAGAPADGSTPAGCAEYRKRGKVWSLSGP